MNEAEISARRFTSDFQAHLFRRGWWVVRQQLPLCLGAADAFARKVKVPALTLDADELSAGSCARFACRPAAHEWVAHCVPVVREQAHPVTHQRQWFAGRVAGVLHHRVVPHASTAAAVPGLRLLPPSSQCWGRHSDFIARVNAHGLHFAFLDPFDLAALNFDIIVALSSLKRIDMLVHISQMDLQRNLVSYATKENSPFDALMLLPRGQFS